MKLVSCLAAFLCTCALALAACGSSDSGGSDDGLASLAPQDTPFYFEFTTQPSDQQQATLSSLISRFDPQGDFAGGGDFDQAIQDLLDMAAEQDTKSDLEISYADDIQSWLGAEGSFWIPELPADYDGAAQDETPAVFAVESTDDDAAQAFIDKVADASPDDVEKKEVAGIDAVVDPDGNGVVGVDDGYVILASTEQDFTDAVEAGDSDSLAGEDDFASSFKALSDETFASAYVDLGPFVENNSTIDPDDLATVEKVYPDLLDTPVTAALSATDDSIALDISGDAPPGSPSYDGASLTNAPSDAIAAFSIGDLGDQISSALDQIQQISEDSGETSFDPDQIDQAVQAQTGLSLDDIESTLGSADFYVSGDFPSDYVLGFQIGLKQDGSDLFDALQQAVQASPSGTGTKIGPPLGGGDQGFSVELPPPSDPTDTRYVDVSLDGDEATILASPDKAALVSAASDSGSISDSAAFTDASDALGDDFTPIFFLDAQSLVDAVDASGTTVDLDGQRVLDFLGQQGEYAVLGVGNDGSTARITFGLKPGE